MDSRNTLSLHEAFRDDLDLARLGGTVLLIEPNSKQFVERGRFDQPDRSKQPAWAHPVIANGKLYLRDQDALLCYDVKAK
jgi:alcohol dehydrogenase (cytochrome c)